MTLTLERTRVAAPTPRDTAVDGPTHFSLPSGRIGRLLGLQQTIGNAAVSRLIARQTAGRAGPGVIQRQVCAPGAATTAASGVDVQPFGHDSAQVPASADVALQLVKDELARGDGTATVEVHGYASMEGDPDYNRQLSCDRATNVRDALRARGVRNPITLVAHGPSEALGSDLEANRIVVIVTPLPSDTGTDEPPSDSGTTPPPPSDAGTTPTPSDGGTSEPPSDGGTPEPPTDDAGAPPPACTTPGCPDAFCQPFPTQHEAEADRAANGASLVSGLPNAAARPLFQEFVDGGGAARDISAEHADAFTNSDGGIATSQAFQRSLEAAINAHPPTFPPGEDHVTLNILDILDAATVQSMANQLTFHDPSEVPGLIAGGIGINQSTCPVGHIPSTQNDRRAAEGTVTVFRNTDGSLFIERDITFTVVDTLDFCPGNCGGFLAQTMTIPFSRWEASRISGDVPFTVRFPAHQLIGAYDSE